MYYVCLSHKLLVARYMLCFQSMITAILQNANACRQLRQEITAFYLLILYYTPLLRTMEHV